MGFPGGRRGREPRLAPAAVRQVRDRQPQLPLDLLEALGERHGAGEPVLGGLGHRLRDRLVHRAGHVGAAERRRRVVEDPQHQLRDALALRAPERGLPRQQLVQRRAQRVDVGGDAGRAALQHLGRGVVRRERLGVALVEGVHQPGDAEVGQRGLAVPGDQDVLRLDVAVQHVGLVRGGQRARHLDADPQHLGDRQRALPLQAVGERAVLEVLHRDVGAAGPGGPGVQHRHDVGMARQPAGDLAFALEAAQGGVVHGADRQHLQRHHAVQAFLVRAVDDAEPALADLLQHPVAGNVLGHRSAEPSRWGSARRGRAAGDGPRRTQRSTGTKGTERDGGPD
ncbi:hypothetical protein GCM10009678_46220 [Actinomadura kijaniata]